MEIFREIISFIYKLKPFCLSDFPVNNMDGKQPIFVFSKSLSMNISSICGEVAYATTLKNKYPNKYAVVGDIVLQKMQKLRREISRSMFV